MTWIAYTCIVFHWFWWAYIFMGFERNIVSRKVYVNLWRWQSESCFFFLCSEITTNIGTQQTMLKPQWSICMSFKKYLLFTWNIFCCHFYFPTIFSTKSWHMLFNENDKIIDLVTGQPFFSVSGGRNMTISLQSRTGHMNMEGVVGMLVFTQFWFWYPLTLFLSMAFTPTCLVGLNEDLKVSSSHKYLYFSNHIHLIQCSTIVWC